MAKTNTSRRNGLLTWSFIRALVRIYIAYVKAYMCVGAKIPEWLVNMLPAAERITSGMLWAMLVAPEVLATLTLNRGPIPQARQHFEALIISETELRVRIAKIKAILKDPREETARLKAIADARGIKLVKLAGVRPIILLIAPHTDDMRIAYTSNARRRRAGLGPPSHAPPFLIPAGQGPPYRSAKTKIVAGEATASAATRVGKHRLH